MNRTTPQPPPNAGSPGASARREYTRRRAQREARARAQFGPLGALTRLLGDPQSTRAWKQGAEGELEVAARLARHLRRHDVVLLHDRRIPGRGRANIDHLAIGPGGVTVIDTKSSRGGLRVQSVGGLLSPRRERLLLGRRDCTHLLDAMHRQLKSMQGALRGLELDELDVRGALCFPHVEGLPALGQLRVHQGTIVIDHPRGVAKLVRRSGPLAPEEITLIAGQLARRFPAA